MATAPALLRGGRTRTAWSSVLFRPLPVLAYAGICSACPVYMGLWCACAALTAPFGAAGAVDEALYHSYQNLIRAYFQLISGVKIVLHGDAPRDEGACYLSNHQSNADWFVVDLLAAETATGMGKVTYILKESLKAMPFYGLYFWLHGCVYLNRELVGDQARLVKHCTVRSPTGSPRWIVIFPEGTRYNPAHTATIAESQRVACAKGFDPARFEKVLFPRIKGFTTLTGALQKGGSPGENAVVYDVTIAYGKPGEQRPADCSMEAMMHGTYREIHIRLDRIPLEKVGITPAAAGAWLTDSFARKSAVLDAFYGDGRPLSENGVVATVSRAELVMHWFLWNSLIAAALGTKPGRRLYAGLTLCFGFAVPAATAAWLAVRNR